MKSLLVFFFLLTSVVAHDGIVWSTDDSNLFNFNLPQAVATASVDHPIIVILLEEFTLSEFNKYADVYSQIKNDRVIHRPLLKALHSAREYNSFSYKYNDNEPLEFNGDGVHIMHAMDLKDLDDHLTSKLNAFKSKKYTVCLLNRQAIKPVQHQRSKRETLIEPLSFVAINGSDCAMSIDEVLLTLRLERQPDATYCLYYDNSTESDANTAPYKRSCNEMSTCGTSCDPPDLQIYKTTFQMRFIGGEPCPPFNTKPQADVAINSVTLQFTFDAIMDQNWWRLSEVTIIDMDKTGFEIPTTTTAGVTDAYITTIYYNAWTCPLTDPVHAEDEGGNTVIAFQFKNFTAQPFGWMNVGNSTDNTTIPYITSQNALNPRRLDSCVPMFSIANYMAYFIVMIMLIFFSFILMLLTSLQTNDRYDDPKQKELVITVKGE